MTAGIQLLSLMCTFSLGMLAGAFLYRWASTKL